jgi:hypothetical protein
MWLVVEAGVVDLMLAFQGVAALPVVVAQFVVNGAMFLSFQALPGGRPLPAPELGSRDSDYVSAEPRRQHRCRKNHGRMVFETMFRWIFQGRIRINHFYLVFMINMLYPVYMI